MTDSSCFEEKWNSATASLNVPDMNNCNFFYLDGKITCAFASYRYESLTQVKLNVANSGGSITCESEMVRNFPEKDCKYHLLVFQADKEICRLIDREIQWDRMIDSIPF